MSDNKTICIYFHINPIKNEIFYVGMGNIKRPFTKNCRSKWWKNITNKYGFIVNIIHKNLTWEEACILEKMYINKIGRKDLNKGPLINMTDGGEGIKNPSKEIRDKISKSSKGRIMSKEQKIKLSICKIGKKQSQETINKRTNKIKGRKYSEKHCLNISKSLIGKIVSIETKEKFKKRMLGIKHSEETKKRMSLSQLNKNTKPIIQMDLNNNFIKEWNSTSNAGKELKIAKTGITNCINKRAYTAGGFKWKLKN